MFVVLSSRHDHRKSLPGSLDEYRLKCQQVAADRQAQRTKLDCMYAADNIYHRHLSKPAKQVWY